MMDKVAEIFQKLIENPTVILAMGFGLAYALKKINWTKAGDSFGAVCERLGKTISFFLRTKFEKKIENTVEKMIINAIQLILIKGAMRGIAGLRANNEEAQKKLAKETKTMNNAIDRIKKSNVL